MADQREIYERHAEEYDALVSAEDWDGRLVPAIDAIAPLASADVLDVGTGTGRIARLVAPKVARVVGVDRSAAMLAIARRRLETLGTRFELHCAEATALPVPSGWADVAIAGWVFGHFCHWMPDGWQGEVTRAIGEMRRALKPSGAIVIIEKLGTGSETPSPPNDALASYYAWLEAEHGFARTSVRTDYRFADVETAARTTGFFFGDAFAARARAEGWARVPECTGIWSRRA